MTDGARLGGTVRDPCPSDDRRNGGIGVALASTQVYTVRLGGIPPTRIHTCLTMTDDDPTIADDDRRAPTRRWSSPRDWLRSIR